MKASDVAIASVSLVGGSLHKHLLPQLTGSLVGALVPAMLVLVHPHAQRHRHRHLLFDLRPVDFYCRFLPAISIADYFFPPN
jgi:hypothetical protein